MFAKEFFTVKVLRCIHHGIVCNETDFCIDDDVFIVRQVDDHIGLNTLPVFIARAELNIILASLRKSGSLEDTLEDHLSPISLLLGIALQSPRKIIGFVANALV